MKPAKSRSRRKEENEQVAWRTTGKGQDNYIKMVYQYLPTRFG